MKWTTRVLLMSLCLCGFAPAASAQDPPAEVQAPAGLQRPGFTPPSQDPQPYDRVITKDAKSKKGVFTVHQVKDKYYYEIPKSEYNKEFLWVTQIARTTNGVGYGGQALGNRVVRWERNGNKIQLRNIDYSVVADPRLPVARAVQAANNDAIIMSFPVAAWGQNEAAVIEVTRLFTTDVPEFSARQRLSATTMDTSRSYIERVSAYPTNIEAEASHTYTRTTPPAGLGAPTPVAAGGMRPGSATVVMHFSLVKLPEKPMMPRVFDERVGYFSVSQMDYGRDEHRAPQRTYITRWRLEKKDPNAAVSEPVKPIVYWIDAATPTKWIPYMKRGVEKWQKAFEAAGFKNAILAKEAPTPEQDPDFSPEDARYSVIRWLPSTIENASGPHIHDPRTGEILESDIQFYHNIMNLQRSWYFLQAGPLDPRAQKLPLPDDLMGVLLEYVVAHEVGHTLGFQHNMKASSMYPQDKVHDREWVHKMGHTPTLMDYSRFNYVAQPEDNIPVEDLIPGIGPYDVWATIWGYKPIAGARTADDEKATLDEWAREQDKTPWLRFSTAGSAGSDPGELTEAVGDADAVKSTALGIKNLQRVAKMLMAATTTEKGQPYEDLEELYGRMFGQWTLELNHVAAIVGGFNTQQKHIGQQGTNFNPISKARQQEAVRFLNENAFATPTWALDKEILRRIEPIGALNRVRNAQNSVLNSLLSSSRFARLVEQQALDGDQAYQPADFLADVRKGVWKELDAPQVKIDPYRRNLQRAYLDLTNNKLNGAAPTLPQGLPAAFASLFVTSGDERPMYRAELRALNASVGTALARTTDRATKAHLEGVRDQIAKILDPKFAAGNAAATGVIRFGFNELDVLLKASESCWPDYIIRP
ncbi:MAG TPA: zinc-dependent metalloprotease [Blastocatellia bacterium]|nr:zinc-dependent metalloprotease [Blastocatellia bacterium]HMV86856.1 zinc-dependent metalloprotease [Blastocatellia bacterium]HMX26328.1 zinc-dependent metalloprotease [Blastocatellia bacterium]HMY74346.1 zinc-dependent metalloprotease [Blastocatellia bacterium]HMZ18758.1 zinc-dependent metalloprotease [Blastocatellia bacterium]